MKRTGNLVELETQALPEEISLPVKIALYRIVQEALSNSYRHAGVEQYRVGLWPEDGYICLEVRDDGRGFDPPNLDQSVVDEHEAHIGLRACDRAAILGGHFEIATAGAGTRIFVKPPIGCANCGWQWRDARITDSPSLSIIF
ncbi:MAG: ATP-binding protein [Caldilineaceae bacterium]